MKIKGIPIGTTSLRPNWEQTDNRKSDYIRNKPDLNKKQNKLGWVTDADIDAMFAGTYVGDEDESPNGSYVNLGQISVKVVNGVLCLVEEATSQISAKIKDNVLYITMEATI